MVFCFSFSQVGTRIKLYVPLFKKEEEELEEAKKRNKRHGIRRKGTVGGGGADRSSKAEGILGKLALLL